MTTIIAGILMLGVLVFVHELGHFVVAKLCGVKVLKFSLGFGPRLAARQWGETVYQICLIPLGGYVQMLGEGRGEQGEESPAATEDLSRSFAEKPVSRRLAIVSAGPLMNLILPFLILPVSYMVGVDMPVYLEKTPCIGYVAPESDAAAAGFRSNDCIVAINDQAVESWNAANKAFVAAAGQPLVFTVDRQNQSLQLTMPADNDSLEGMQALGLLPQQLARIGALAPDMPAAQAGMQVGDLIVAIGGQEIASWYDLKRVIQGVAGQSVPVTLERSGDRLIVDLIPRQPDQQGEYLIGISPLQENETRQFGFLAAIQEGAERTWELIELTLVFIQKLFSGSVSAKNIGGPITVVQVAGQAAQTDLSAILSVLAFISIQLGILNLLPIPILDGGHILFYLIELLIRRPLSARARDMAQQVGMAMLLMLMVLAFYNDISRLW